VNSKGLFAVQDYDPLSSNFYSTCCSSVRMRNTVVRLTLIPKSLSTRSASSSNRRFGLALQCIFHKGANLVTFSLLRPQHIINACDAEVVIRTDVPADFMATRAVPASVRVLKSAVIWRAFRGRCWTESTFISRCRA